MKVKLIGVGELIWDLFPEGRQMGGAPANFAYHAAALGAEGIVISRVGKDDLGRELLERLKKLGLSTEAVEVDPSAPTGTVSVKGDPKKPELHVIHENVAWDHLNGEKAAREAVANADAVCFGTLAQRQEPARSAIRSLLAETPRTALRIFDINLRQNYYSPELIEQSLALASVLKVNDSELPGLAEMFQLEGDERAQISQIARRHRLRAVAFTRGERGSMLFADGQWSDHPSVPAKVVDTVGAGDAFTAAMTLGILAGWKLDRINEQANAVAAFVTSCAGATPSIPAHLREMFAS